MPDFVQVARQAAVAEGLNPTLFTRQIKQESGFQVAPSGRGPNGEILPNSSGATGIVQVVPKDHPDAPPATDPVGQIKWMAKYMGGLVKQYGGYAPALSVYNSGRADAYKDPNFAKGQTYNYVRSIMGGAHSELRGLTPTPVAPDATPTVTAPSSTVDPMTAVRQTAAQGFADIAQGKARPEDTFGNLLATLKSVQPQVMPQVKIPAGSGKLESQAATLVKKYLGVQYQYGGATPGAGFDCSGLVQYVWKTLGVTVPRTSQEQFKSGQAVQDLQPGDAVFFVGSDGTKDAPGHEGMYIGNGKYIAAPHTGAVVSVFNLADAPDYVGARRFA